MKRLFLDCGMGAAGDMLTAALFELLDDEEKQTFLDTMKALAPEGVSISIRPEIKCGLLGSHFDVVINGEEEQSLDYHEHTHGDHVHTHEHTHDGYTHAHEHTHGEHVHTHEHNHSGHSHEHALTHHSNGHAHAHHSMADVENIVNGFDVLSEDVRKSIMDVYRLIAEAESAVHGIEVSEMHFHEVGMMDAIIDVTAACLLMDMLRPDQVYASPVRVGKGHVKCAHGILPVPAPATARLLLGVPVYSGNIEAELCTPTGAALLRHFVSEFGDQPVMTVRRIGYGMGTKDFEVCNCVRALME